MNFCVLQVTDSTPLGYLQVQIDFAENLLKKLYLKRFLESLLYLVEQQTPSALSLIVHVSFFSDLQILSFRLSTNVFAILTMPSPLGHSKEAMYQCGNC